MIVEREGDEMIITSNSSTLESNVNAYSQIECYPIGGYVKFDDKIWLCVHYDASKVLYLCSQYVILTTTFGTANNNYAESILASVAKQWEINNLSPNVLNYIADTTVYNVTSKVFVASNPQLRSFQYFKENTTRLITKSEEGAVSNWWTSTPGSGSSKVHVVESNGQVAADTYHYQSNAGFRPFIGLKM